MSKTETKSTVLLKHHLKALKLPTMLAEAEKGRKRRPRPSTPATEEAIELAQGQLSEDQEPDGEEHTSENDEDGEVVENKAQESTTESDEKETE